MKKIIATIFMFVMIIFGAVSFLGCGGGENGAVVYEAFHVQVEDMKSATAPFEQATREGISSNFMLKNFIKKVSDTSKVDYGDQDNLIALGLNFIEKYYPLTKNYEVGQDLTQIKESLSKMTESYEILKEEYQNTRKLDDNEVMTIYNGFMARYAEAARNFSSKVYDCAQQLAHYLSVYVEVDKSIVEVQPTALAVEFYVEKNLLNIYDDYNDFLMENCKASAGSMQKKWYALEGKSVKTNLSQATLEKTIAYFDAVDGERKLTHTALEKFSYYDYQVLYNGDVKAYEKVDTHASIYLAQIQKYYNNYLVSLNDFYLSNLYE